MSNENTTPDVQGFDVTPHAQPEPQQAPTAPLVSFATTAPEQSQQPQQPQQAAENPYQVIIDQQNAQIAALIDRTNALNAQITKMVQGGAQISQPAQPVAVTHAQPQQQPQEFPPVYDGGSPMQQFAPPSLASEQDWSLEGLADQIGK